MSRRLREKAKDERIGFELSEISLSDKYQVIWLFPLLPILRNGQWPYDTRCETGHSKYPSFQTPVELAAELDRRLEKTRQDGAMVELFYNGQRSYESIGKQFNLSLVVVKANIRKGLAYICDSQAHKRGLSYSEWRKLRRPKRLHSQTILE